MAYSVQYIVGATTYNLSDSNPFEVLSITGLGIAPVRRLLSRAALQNGSTDVGYLFDDRLLNLEIFISGANRSEMVTNRQTLATAFRPSTTAGKLRITEHDGSVRQIDCHLAATLDMPAVIGQRADSGQFVIVQLRASSPHWYDPTLQTLPYYIAPGGAEGYQFPIEFPWNQSPANVIDDTQTISYAGTAPTYPEIEITGPADTPLIRNLDTDEKIEFNGNILAGDVWTVTITDDSVDVTDSNGDSVLQYVTDDSDPATFHLEPGDNDVQVQILSGATVATAVALRWYNRYLNQ